MENEHEMISMHDKIKQQLNKQAVNINLLLVKMIVRVLTSSCITRKCVTTLSPRRLKLISIKCQRIDAS